MQRHRYSIEQPVRLKCKWAATLTGLLGLGLGIAGTIAATPVLSPAPAPAPIAVLPAVAAVPAPVVPVPPPRPEFDTAPWVSTLRTGIVEIRASLDEMPTLKAPAYKTPFDAITSKVQALELSVSEFEQAALQHKTELEAPAAPMAPSSQPITSQ